jgi:hypothetical protein
MRDVPGPFDDGGIVEQLTSELAECRARLAKVERERDSWREAALDGDCDGGCGCGEQHCMNKEPCYRHLLRAARARADRAEADATCLEADYETRLDAAIAACAQLRAALVGTVRSATGFMGAVRADSGKAYPWEPWEHESHAAGVALASTTLGAGWVGPERLRKMMELAWWDGYATPAPTPEHAKLAVDALLAEVKP